MSGLSPEVGMVQLALPQGRLKLVALFVIGLFGLAATGVVVASSKTPLTDWALHKAFGLTERDTLEDEGDVGVKCSVPGCKKIAGERRDETWRLSLPVRGKGNQWDDHPLCGHHTSVIRLNGNDAHPTIVAVVDARQREFDEIDNPAMVFYRARILGDIYLNPPESAKASGEEKEVVATR